MVLRGALFNGADVIMFIFWEKNLKGSEGWYKKKRKEKETGKWHSLSKRCRRR